MMIENCAPDEIDLNKGIWNNMKRAAAAPAMILCLLVALPAWSSEPFCTLSGAAVPPTMAGTCDAGPLSATGPAGRASSSATPIEMQQASIAPMLPAEVGAPASGQAPLRLTDGVPPQPGAARNAASMPQVVPVPLAAPRPLPKLNASTSSRSARLRSRPSNSTSVPQPAGARRLATTKRSCADLRCPYYIVLGTGF